VKRTATALAVGGALATLAFGIALAVKLIQTLGVQ